MFSTSDPLAGPYLDLALLLRSPNSHTASSDNMTREPELSFNDLLDIAKEYEQTHQPELETTPASITSDAPPQVHYATNRMSSENTSTSHERPSRANLQPQDSVPYRFPTLEYPEPIDPFPDIDLSPSSSVCQANITLSQSADHHSCDKENDTHAAPKLLGWSPPDGSEALDIGPSEMNYPPWLAKLLNPTVLTRPSSSRSSSMQSENHVLPLPGDMRLSEPTPPTRGKTISPPSTQVPPTRVILGPLQAQSSAKRTCRPYSTTITAAGYAGAPRGGVPPQLARDVTRANILRVEQERERIRKAAVSNVLDLRRPSVMKGLDNNAKASKGTVDVVELRESVDGAVRGRKRVWDEKAEEARGMKRTRL